MKHNNSNDQSAIRWNAARRKRNQSRFLIRERIKEESLVPTSISTLDESSRGGGRRSGEDKDEHTDENVNDYGRGGSKEQIENDTDLIEENKDASKLQPILNAISFGHTSFFSLQLFSTQYPILSQLIPTKLLSTYKIQTLCTSRFGVEYANAVLKYVQECVDCCTMLEYAILLGEYGVAQSFISGGINPCDLVLQLQKDKSHYQQQHHTKKDSTNNNQEKNMERITAMVMKKLVVALVPPSLVVYMAKCFFNMRLWSRIQKKEYDHSSSSTTITTAAAPNNDEICLVCTSLNNSPVVLFPSCHHSLCECCMWENMVCRLNERINGDVVECPICDNGASSNSSDDTNNNNNNNNRLYTLTDPTLKCAISLDKFHQLPKDAKELKKLPKRPKRKNVIHFSWDHALAATIGSSQHVRSDKFKRYVDLGAVHHCRACLESGIDVNMTNEYKQTPLYIACWRSHVDVVNLLLDWGADMSLCANGSMSVMNIAVACGNHEIVQILRNASGEDVGLTSLSIQKRMMNVSSGCAVVKPQLTNLIHDQSHEGYGAFYIDDFFDEVTMSSLDLMFQSVPAADNSEVKQKKLNSNIPCSLRHYICDAEGHICHRISKQVEYTLSLESNLSIYKGHKVQVFPHMRFLNYHQTGSELLPHIDLTKINPHSGERSTHTFILYLNDCEQGGETALLQKLSEDGPQAFHQVIEPPTRPRRSRLLIFPHACPHQGMKVISTPKILLRGEIRIHSL